MDLLKLLNVKENYQVPSALLSVMLDKNERTKLMDEINDYDEIYQYFSENQSDRNKFMQDFTPESIRKIVFGIIGERKTVADICAGIGGLSADIKSDYFRCSELSESAIPFLLLNMAMKNVDCDIENKDVLTGETKKIYHLQSGDRYSDIQIIESVPEMKYDAAISNPPYSLKFDEVEDYADDPRFRQFGLTPKAKSDYLFVLHCLHQINDDGVAVLILPHGVLFRGQKEGDIRKKLIEENLIEAIIGLPGKLFINTDIPTIIMVLRRQRSEKGIYFIDASRDYKKEKAKNYLDGAQIRKIIDAYNGRAEEEKYSRLVRLKEIEENDYNLNIPRYIDSFEKEELPPLSETINNICEIEKEIDRTEAEIIKYMEQLVCAGESTDKDFQKALRRWKRHCKRKQPREYGQMSLEDYM